MEYIPEQKIRIVLVGDSHVGKTSILSMFADNNFMHSHIPTIGVDFRFRKIKVENQTVKLQIWDTAGHERFNSITNSYYRGSDVVCLVYDISKRASFQNIPTWITAAKTAIKDFENIVFVIVGNKSDKSDREVTEEEGASLAAKNDAIFFEVSALNRKNINEIFQYMGESVIRRRWHLAVSTPSISQNPTEGTIVFKSTEMESQPRRFFSWCF